MFIYPSIKISGIEERKKDVGIFLVKLFPSQKKSHTRTINIKSKT